MAEVTFDQVSKVYPDGTRAVDDMTSRSQDGEFMVLVGPSGCGKTTALRMVAGPRGDLRGRRSGSASASSTTSRRSDRDIAMVFQSYALYPHLSVYENIAFGLRREEGAEGRDRPARARGRRHARARGVPQAQAARALGRPAPARRDGPGDRPPARGVPDGRAALEPRREAPRADARRDRPPPERPRRDDDLRHARPGRGDDDGRPGRRHAQGRAPAGRDAAGALRPPGQPLRRRLHRQPGDEHARGDARARERRRSRPGSATRSSRSATSCSPTARRCEGYEGRTVDARHPARGPRGRRARDRTRRRDRGCAARSS